MAYAYYLTLRISWASAAVLVAWIGALPAAAHSDPAVEAAAVRQGAVKSVDVSYTEQEISMPGSLTESNFGQFKPKESLPKVETKLISHNRLAISGNMVRVENNHPIWQVPEGTTQGHRI